MIPMTEPTPAPRMTAATLTRRLPMFLLLGGAVAGAVFLRDVLDFDALSRHRAALIDFRDSHYALAVLGFIAAYVLIVAFSLPGATVATLTGGFLFGIFPGVLFNVIGATLGAVLIFLAVRAGLGQRLAQRLDASDGAVGRLKRGLDANLWEMLFLMRLVPVVPFVVANLVPGLVGVRVVPFAVTTFLGIMPGALVFTAIGAGMGEVLARGETPDLSLFLAPHVIGPILGLAALAALPMLIRALRSKRERAE